MILSGSLTPEILGRLIRCAEIGVEALDDPETLDLIGWTREQADEVEAALHTLRRDVTYAQRVES